MSRERNSGFTIIETMLFLAIAGTLAVIVIAGTATSINSQRYRDSVSGLQSYFQKQYSEVANIYNDTGTQSFCHDTSSTSNRGQSSAVILGRFITTSNGVDLYSRCVVGDDPDMSRYALASDLELFASKDSGGMNIRIATQSKLTPEKQTVDWSAKTIPGNFSVLIVRSPGSSSLTTFINPNTALTDDKISQMITSDYHSQSLKLCVDSNGLYLGAKSAVRISASTTGPSGVELLGSSSGC